MRTPMELRMGYGSVRTYLLAIIAIAAVVVAVTYLVRSGPQPETANADSIAAPVSAPASGAYIKIGDIKGESTDDGHKEWINLLSVSQGITRPMSSGISGSTRQRGAATFGDIVVVKEVDKSTPKLQEAIANGRVFPSLELDLTSLSSGGRPAQPYLKWELMNVIVTNYRISGGSASTDRPVETFSLNYEEIKVTYTEQDSTGATKGNVEYSWKVEEGTN